jgi:enoyl-CoA hydratase
MSGILTIAQQGCVRVLSLNDPARRNVLSQPLCDALSCAIADAIADEEAKAVVIAAHGKAFCAGADLDDLIAASTGDMSNVEAVYKSFMDVAACPLPVIAAVDGPAIGAGFNLALACDMRLAGDNALFDCRFLKICLHPGGGHTWLLQRALSWADAAHMVLLGQTADAQEAMRIGLVQGVTSSSGLLAEAITLAQRAAAAPRELLVRTKASLRFSRQSPFHECAEHERVEQTHSLREPDFHARVGQMRDGLGRAKS